MAQKRKEQNTRNNKQKAARSIRVGGDVGGSVIQGNDNTIINNTTVNLSPEKIPLRNLHQLPPAPADFTGREEQLEQVLGALKEHKGAAISGLTGMGGVGKTALGLVAAHQIASQYPDAQIFLDLKGVTDPLSASDALRHVILSFEPTADLREANEEQLAALYQSLLADKKVLVFMDNARDAAQVRPLIPPEACALIVTSRWRFALPHMEPLRLDVLPQEEAVELLLEICRRIGASASEIAGLCGRLPLALRIAATFFVEHGDWQPREYIERLKAKRLKMLKGEEDHRKKFDLELILGASYEQLTRDEQKYWRMLAVFPASFKRGAAAAVWGLDEDAARDLLSKFNRMSLLDYDEKNERYSLHDLLAEFARGKLSKEENFSASFNHANYFMKLAGDADELYLEGGQKILQGLALFDSEWTHIQAGQGWAAANRNASKEITELVMMFPGVSAYCLDLRLPPRAKINWLQSAVTAARALERKDMEGVHLGNLGLAYADLGEARKAIEFYEQALSIAREIGDRRGEGNALGNLGSAYLNLGEARKAIEFYEQALAIAREIGDRRGEGNALFNMSLALHGLGEKEKALSYAKKALEIFEAIESPHVQRVRGKLKEWGGGG